MKKTVITKCIITTVLSAGMIFLCACGGLSGDAYEEYAIAYGRVRANNGFDADLTADLTMDGEKVEATGNFKVDDSGDSTLLYLTVDVDGETMTQFSDGEYLYTDAKDNKTKYPLGEKPSEESGNEMMPEEVQNGELPEFDTDSFLEEFASFLEAGKINELGLLSAIPKAGVNSTTKDGDTYTLEINEDVLEKYLEELSASVTGSDDGDSVEVSNLKDFTYTATISDDYISDVSYKGTMDVKVPGSLMTDGTEADYSMDFVIKAHFNDPGSKVTIELPDTSEYE